MKHTKFDILIPVVVFTLLMILCTSSVARCDVEESNNVVFVEVEPQLVYNIASVEREMLARLVFREGNTESIECQRAIVSVVINRWQNGAWGDTLEEVVYAKNQFEPANLLYCTTPLEQNYEAVDYVLKNGVTVPEYVMYFRANYYFNWSGYKAYCRIDHTYFGYMTADIK